MSDEFFDDEQELMEAQATTTPAPASAAPRRSAAAAADEGDGRLAPPPFWMVIAIAAIALVLGVVIGYLLGSSATLAQIESNQAMSQTDTSGEDTSAYELPEGHPDVTVDEDGTAHVTDTGDGQTTSDTDAAE